MTDLSTLFISMCPLLFFELLLELEYSVKVLKNLLNFQSLWRLPYPTRFNLKKKLNHSWWNSFAIAVITDAFIWSKTMFVFFGWIGILIHYIDLMRDLNILVSFLFIGEFKLNGYILKLIHCIHYGKH